MDNLNYFMKKKERDSIQDARDSQRKIEDARYIKERDEKRRAEEQRASMDAISSISDNKNTYQKDTPVTKPTQTSKDLKIADTYSKASLSPNKLHQESMKQYIQFNEDLRNDIAQKQFEQTLAGMSDREIQEMLIPKEDPDLMKKLEGIAATIKPGKESNLYNVQEGWKEREVQNMLSQEYVKMMNGLPNDAETIEKFLADNPDLMRHEEEDEHIVKQFWNKGVRFAGSGARLQYDGFRAAAKDPASYVWAGTILAASLMAAPVTGGASLAAIPATSAPLLISQMPMLAKSMATLKPLAGITLGMRHGTMHNMADIEAGSAYKEYIDQGIDHRIAAPMASTVGAVNGIIEYMQIDRAMSAIPGVADLANGITKKVKSELVKEVGAVLKNYGKDLTANAIEEMLQGGMTELGMGLSQYMQDTPDPSTVGGLQALKKTMTSERFKDVLLEEGYGALQSMWLSPILSSAGQTVMHQSVQGMVEVADTKRVTEHFNAEQEYRKKDAQAKTEFVTAENGFTDQLITEINETKDIGAIGLAMAEQEILNDILKREDTTNQDKEKITKTKEKIDQTLGKVMYDEKSKNPNIEYRPTNLVDIENEMLEDGYFDNHEKDNQEITNYNVELYKQAQKYNAIDIIKEDLAKGINKMEISKKIEKLFPRKMRKSIELMRVINSVQAIQEEAKSQVNLNKLHNLAEINNNQSKKVVTEEKLAENIAKEDTEIIDTTEGDLTGETSDDSVIVSEEVESLSTDLVEPTEGLQEDIDLADTDIEETETKTDENIETTQEKAGVEYYPSSNIPVMIDIDKIHVDTERFQFRFDETDSRTFSKGLEDTTWNEKYAKSIDVWQDEYGDIYVVNGHNRLKLAQNSGVTEMLVTLMSYKDYTAEEARAEGAMINIADDNATSIDVAKLIRDTGVTEKDFDRVGVKPESKIAKDGRALSQLNDWIFTQVATKGIPIERAIIIGRELANQLDAQNQILRVIGMKEAKGENITNDVLTELIAEAKGTAREDYKEMTLFGEETFTKNYSLERAELASYVKRQLKERVSLLRNVSKNKNAAILQELGNKIKIDDNVQEMNTADQAFWILDSTLNYKGTEINKLFNNLAKEYADVDPMDRIKIKKKALTELIALMEDGQLLSETINQEIKEAAIKDSIMNEGQQQSFGITEEGLAKQVDMFGNTVNQLKDTIETQVVAKETTKETKAYKSTIPIVEAIKNNPIFNGLTIKYTDKSGKITDMTDKELKSRGYEHLKAEEGKPKFIYGFYDNRDRSITLNSEATRDTILEEAIHDIQHRLQEIDPELNELVKEWETEVRENAAKEGIVIPGGYELLAQSLVYTEFGYATTNPFIANMIAVDSEIVDKFRVLLGEEIADKGFGFLDPTVAKSERLLNADVVKQSIQDKIDLGDINIYAHEDNGNYAMVHPGEKGYQVSYFNESIGHIVDMDFKTSEEVSSKLIDDEIYQLKDRKKPYGEIFQRAIQINPSGEYDRSVANELYERNFTKDTSKFTAKDIGNVRNAINNGNFTIKDYNELIKDNEAVNPHARKVLGDLVQEANKKGFHLPNNEATFKQFMYRFYGVDLMEDMITNKEVASNFIYYRDNSSIEEITSKLKADYKHFQDNITTYRHEDLTYQIKPMMEKIDTKEFKNWFGKSKVVNEDGTPKTVYHGSLWNFNEFKSEYMNHVSFFSETEEFAREYADSKAFEGEIDNDRVIYEVYLSINKLFDPSNEEDLQALREAMGDKVDYGFTNNKMTTGEFLDRIAGRMVTEPFWSKEQLDNAKFGRPIGESREGYNTDRFIAVKGDNVMYVNNRDSDLLELLNEKQKETLIETGRVEVEYLADRYEDYPMQIFALNEKDKMLDMGFQEWKIGVKKDTITTRTKSITPTIYEGQNNWTYFELSDTMNTIRELGYEGIKMQENGVPTYAVFNPTSIKSINNEGTFSPMNTNIYYQMKEKAPMFYSKLQQAVDEKLQNNANPKSVMNMIRNAGVRQDEIAWSGIETWLEDRDKVDKAELQEFLMFNSVDIVEDTQFSKYEQYTEAGGEKYKERLFILNENISYTPRHKEILAKIMDLQKQKEELTYMYHNHDLWEEFKGENLLREIDTERNELIKEMQQESSYKTQLNRKPYRSGHYNVDNILAHTRHKDRKTADGSKVLFLEEIQSDWHQEGRDKGYEKEFIETIADATGVPDAPLKNTWHEYVLKRMIRVAAEEGYDYLSWTTGEQQNERYKLSSIIDSLEVSTDPSDETYNFIASRDDEQILTEINVLESELASYLGKEMALKIIEDKRKMKEELVEIGFDDYGDYLELGTYEKLDLEVGGEGMKGFYNQMIPRFLKKYVKKWGSDVEVIRITEEGKDIVRPNIIDMQQLAIPITDQMRESVLSVGQPLFQLKSETQGNLLAMHNLSEANLQNIFKLGAIPVPSIAIAKKSMPLQNFGEISLLFNKDTIDPNNRANKVFASDVYSKRFPSVGYEIDTRKLRQLSDEMGTYIDESQLETTSIDEAVNRLKSKTEIQKAFLNDNGIIVEMPMIKKKLAYYFHEYAPLKDFIIKNDLTFEKLMKDPKLLDEYNDLAKQGFIEGRKPSDFLDRMAQTVEDALMEEIEYQSKTSLRETDRNVMTYNKDFQSIKGINTMVEDWHSYRENLALEISSKSKEFNSYLTDKLTPIYGRMGIRNDKDIFTPSGNRRSWQALHEEMNINNILKNMKGDIRGQEGFHYGLGTVRAGRAIQFSSIQEIIDSQELITDNKTFEATKEIFNNQYTRLQTELNKYHPSTYGSAFDNSMLELSRKRIINKATVMSELVKDGFDVANISDDLITEITDFMQDLKYMETEYFEAKPQRAVDLNEIQAIIAPDTLSAETEQLINGSGKFVIEKYAEGKRQESIDKLLNKKDLTFQVKDTTTPEFKNWFKGSKVVDEEGKPIKVYHGGTVIDTFDTTRGSFSHMYGNGSYFAEGIGSAEEYADFTGGAISEYYLSAQNIYNDKDAVWEKTISRDKLEKSLIELGFTDRDIGIVFGNIGSMDRRWNYRRLRDLYLDITGKNKENYNDINVLLQNAGYDGIEGYLDNGGTQYVVFNPKQIKSVDNRGTWDATDTNMYYQIKDSNDFDELSWPNTVANAGITSQEMKDFLLSNPIQYEVKHNKDTMLAGAKLIDTEGEANVEATILSSGELTTEEFAAGQILFTKFMEDGENERAIAITHAMGHKVKTLGQSIQILSQLGKETPEGMVRMTAKRFSDLMTDRDKININKKTEAIKTEFNRINKEAAQAIDFIKGVKDLQGMDAIEMATKDMLGSKKGKQLVEKHTLETIIAAMNGEQTEIEQTDLEEVLGFKKDKTNIDIDMATAITNTMNKHFLDGDTNLKKKLMDLGLTEFEAEILDSYAKMELREATKDSKQEAIKKNLGKKKYESETLENRLLEASLEMDEDKLRALIAEKEGMPILDKELIDYIYNQGKYIQTLEEGSRERDIETAKLVAEISNRLPTSMWEKVGTIQTMAHLLNVRTTARNLIGNELFGKVDTITMNYLGAGFDKAISLKTGQRTTLHRNIFKLFKHQYQGYGQGFKLGLEDAMLGIDTGEGATRYGLRKQRTFTKGVFGKLETTLNITMRATDQAAQMAGYFDSLQEQMMIAGVDKPTEEMMDRAAALGLYRTFNDETMLSTGFKGAKKAMNAVSGYFTGQTEFGLGDIFLKYPGTPANILARALDYSPIGLVTTMTKLMKDTTGDTYLRQRMAVEGLARATSGMGMMAIGYGLAKLGIITGGDPDEDKNIYEMKKQAGLQDYGVNTSALQRHIDTLFYAGKIDEKNSELKRGDHLVTYDWVEPSAIPIAIGADVADGGVTLSTLDTIARASTVGMQALVDQPVLSGLTKLFAYGDPVKGTGKGFLDLPSSFTPTLFGHIANLVDGEAKEGYAGYSIARRSYNAILNKLPGAKSTLPTRFDRMGEPIRYYEEDANLISRILRSVVSPAFSGDYKPTKEEQLIFDLYDSTGSTDHVPRRPQREYTFDGVKYKLTPEEHETMSEWIGKELTSRINYAEKNYMGSWDDEGKVAEIKWIIGNLEDEAREKVKGMKGIR